MLGAYGIINRKKQKIEKHITEVGDSKSLSLLKRIKKKKKNPIVPAILFSYFIWYEEPHQLHRVFIPPTLFEWFKELQ